MSRISFPNGCLNLKYLIGHTTLVAFVVLFLRKKSRFPNGKNLAQILLDIEPQIWNSVSRA